MKYLPLYNAINSYAESSPARFHMPGHKGKLSPLDVTEVAGTDNLHCPSGPILESENLASHVFGAKQAYFLVNGSSAGNLAMLSLLKPGSRVLLGRNCHKSAISGLALAGMDHSPVYPDENGAYSVETIANALDKEPCCAVLITSPAYNGVVSPINEIAKAVHERGALLFVDCAHGAHFAFSDRLPDVPSAADAWCVSTHKTLSALTQTALLLIGESAPFEREKVQRILGLYQSTSPSYEFMLSIESAVLTPGDWNSHVSRIERLREALSAIPEIKLLALCDIKKYDLTRLYIEKAGMNGYALARYLEEERIICEMADSRAVTLITTPDDPDEWYERLIRALSRLKLTQSPFGSFRSRLERSRGAKVKSVREAVMGETEQQPLESAAGRVCASAVGCYPPGVAILFPGELITEEAVRYLCSEAASGAELFGTLNGTVTVTK